MTDRLEMFKLQEVYEDILYPVVSISFDDGVCYKLIRQAWSEVYEESCLISPFAPTGFELEYSIGDRTRGKPGTPGIYVYPNIEDAFRDFELGGSLYKCSYRGPLLKQDFCFNSRFLKHIIIRPSRLEWEGFLNDRLHHAYKAPAGSYTASSIVPLERIK